MPCKIQIKKNITEEIENLSKEAIGMSLEDATTVADGINSDFGTEVISFKEDKGDVLKRIIEVPPSLVQEYYDHELSLEEDEEQVVEEPFDYVKDFSAPTDIKDGVKELFDSTPELANAVYEALGFNNFSNQEKEQLIEQLRNPLFDLVRGTELYNKYKGETIPYGYSESSWKLLISGINESKLDLNKILSGYKKRLLEEQNTPIRETGIDEKTGLPIGFNPSTGTFEGGFGEVSEKENAITKSKQKIAVLEKFIEQKQQAQQLYSQYLNSIFPDSKVKDVVYHGTDAEFEKFDKKLSGKKTGWGEKYKGIHFINNKSAAKSYIASREDSWGYLSLWIYLKQYAKSGKSLTKQEFQNILDDNTKLANVLEGAHYFGAIDIDAITYNQYNKWANLFEKDRELDDYSSDNLDMITKDITAKYENKKANIKSAILNIKNPLVYDSKGRRYVQEIESIYSKLTNDNDGIIVENTLDRLNDDIGFEDNIQVVFEPEQIHILGNKQDIEGFKKFVEATSDNEYYQIEPANEQEASRQLDSIVMRFLEKIGVAVQSVYNIKDADGNPINAVAKASMLNKIIEVVEGRSTIDTLPEEAAHFFVEMLGEGHPLFKDMFSRIEGYEVYQTTLDTYKNKAAFKNPDGSINYNKIKKEAIGKVIAEHIVKMDPGAETASNLEHAFTWWQKLWEFVKSIFEKATYNPFEDAATKIMMGETEDLTNEPLEDEEYYQLVDPVEGLRLDQSNITLDNTVDPRTGQKRHIYYYKGDQTKGSVTSYYVDKWLRKIFKTDNRSDIQKRVDLAKAELGDIVHEQMQDLFKSWTDENGRRKDVQTVITPKVNPVIYKDLNKYVQGIMDQYDDDTIYLTEVKIYDKKTNIAGSIDLLVIEPDGTVEIYDWKSQEIFSEQTDIKTYKEPMYRIQLEQYKKILEAQYGFKKFGRVRAIPMATTFNWKDGKPNTLKSLEIGSLDLEKIPENKSYLFPVALRTESTGDSQLDKLITQLNSIYDKIDRAKFKGEELYKRREELAQYRTAIRDLQLRNKVEKLVDLGLVQIKKYTDKINNNTLTGKDIPESISILSVFKGSGTILYELRKEMKDAINPDDKKALENFEKIDAKFQLMSSKVDKLLSDIVEYRDKQSEKLGQKFGIQNLLDPEKAIGTLKGWFSSLSNISQKSFRVFSILLRKVQNERDIKFEKASEKLLELKNNFVIWANTKGISVEKGIEMLLDIDEKGNWNGNFLNIYDPEYYKLKKEASTKGNYKWILENTDYNSDLYNEAEKNQKEFLSKIIYSADESENTATINKKIKDWVSLHRVINPDKTINIKALLNKENRFLKPKEIWYTKKWREVKNNKPLFDMYNYFQSLIRESERNGMLDKYSPHFIPSIMANKMDQLVFGDIKTLMSFEGNFLQNLEVDSGTQYSPEIDPTTGEIINRIPVYFTKDMGVKREDGSIDYGKKSRDLFKIFGTWAAHMYNYEAMDSLEDSALMLLETERNKKSVVTDSFGNIVVEGGVTKIEDPKVKRNAEKLENFVNYYLYDRTNGLFKDVKFKLPFRKDKEYSLLKTVKASIRFFSLKTLGLNILSGTANFVGGEGNALFIAEKGILFTKKSWAKAMYMVVSRDKKAIAALNYMNILQEGNQRNLINDLSLSNTNKILNSDNLFFIQRGSDKAVQYPVALAIMLNHMVEDGKIVDIQKFVKEKYNYNNTFYKLSDDAQKKLMDKIENEVKELQDKRSLLNIGKLDDKGKFSIPGIDKNNQSFFDLKDKIKATSKKILGNNSREDINAIRTTMLGNALMQFRNWMPEMVEERIDGLKYDDELGIWTYGKFNQFFSEMTFKRIPKLAKAIITGFGHNAVDMAKDSYQRLKRDAYEKGEDFTITEGEFIDMYIGNLKSMVSELTLLIGFGSLLLSAIAATGDDDDDKGEKGMKKYMLRAFKKYWSEFSFYYNPIEFTRLTKTPLPVIGLADDLTRFLWNLGKEVIGQASGSKKLIKDAKPLKYFFKMVPIAKEAMIIMATYDDEFRKDWDIQLVPGGY